MSFCLPSQNKEYGHNTENNGNTSNKPFIFAVQIRSKIHDFSMVKYFMTKYTNYQHQKCIVCLILKQLYIMYFQYMFLLWCTPLACSSSFKNLFAEGTRVNLLHKNLSKMHFVLNFQLAIIRNVSVFHIILFGGRDDWWK